MEPDVPEENPVTQDSQYETEELTWRNRNRYNQKSFLLKSTTRIIIYPKEYSKILMQLGYEPKAPVPSVTLLGRPCLLLPNILTYMQYIKKVDGWTGCYRGIVPHILGHSVDTFVCGTICEVLDKYWVLKAAPETTALALVGAGGDLIEHDQHQQQCTEECDIQADFITCIKCIVKDWCCRIAGIVASYPLRVIAIQTMAEFVGREKILRKGIVTAADHIYKEGGILAFYSGIIPKIIGETVHIFSLGCLGYFLRTKVANEEGRAFLCVSINILLGALIYPFQVVSTTMAVNGSGLALGMEPFMPNYRNWLECWSHLADLNQLRRGSSLVFRYYTGPTRAFSNGMRVAYGVHFGPDYSTPSAIA